jgi:hypothetical protein
VTSWTLSLWKASLCCTEQHHFSPTAGSKPACVKLQKIQVSIVHHMQLPYPAPHPRKIIQCNPWVDWTPYPSKTESHK